MITLLIVEDSVTQREIFKRLFAADGQFTVVAEAGTGQEAIAMVRKHSPDVVLMDIHMPDMDGITATREIMQQFPVPIVVASSTLRKHDVDLAMKALQAGAVSVIEKPQGAVLLHLQKIAPALRDELLAAVKAKLRPPIRAASPRRSSLTTRTATSGAAVKVIGICASTGGPPVLLEILRAIPKPYPLPILLVQHISHGFEEGFARWLSETTGQTVGMASDGQRLSPGIWMAPGGRHLTLLGSPARLDLPLGKPADLHCPSGNPLFASLAKHAGANAAGVLLTGMGNDGADGLLALKRAGGMTIIQDEPSCLIWGMPKCAQEKKMAQPCTS
jgi:two-component system, chemotaxis family, protein-glutamate methylesterase/glutaminase